MGIMFSAKCQCGYSERYSFGGGMNNFKTYCGAPTLCKKCARVVQINYLQKDFLCPICNEKTIPLNDISLQKPKKNATGEIFSWHMEEGDFVLPDTSYYCPKCHKKNFQFFMEGCFD